MRRLTPEEAAAWRTRSVKRYQERRKPASATEKSQTPQRARKQAADAEYARNRQMRLVMARGRCEFVEWEYPGVERRCSSAATETHHTMRRSHHVDHGVENLRALCHTHHAYIHAHVEWAKENGWIVTEWREIGERPIES